MSKTRKISKSVWGKNPKLEKFWRKLSSGKNIVVISKTEKYKLVKLPTIGTQKYKSFMDELDNNSDVEAILSSNMSQDSYELYLYPRAKDKSVEYVIKNYNKYFKTKIFKKMRVP